MRLFFLAQQDWSHLHLFPLIINKEFIKIYHLVKKICFPLICQCQQSHYHILTIHYQQEYHSGSQSGFLDKIYSKTLGVIKDKNILISQNQNFQYQNMIIFAKFKNFKMKQQALILQISTFSLVVIIFGLILLPVINRSFEMLIQSSYEAHLKSNDARISLLAKKIEKYIEYGFSQANTSLIKFQQLYYLDFQTNYQYINCSQINKGSGNILAYCYNNKEKLDLTSDYHKFGSFLDQLDSWLLSFQLDPFSNLQMVFRIKKPHFTSIFSITSFPYDFDVESRPYYKEHLSQNNTRYIGNPFVNQATYKLALMITQTIYDQIQNKDLIMAVGFSFENLNKYISLYNAKLVLVSLDGIILANNLRSQNIQALNSIVYIYNQSMIPFSFDDWKQLNAYIKNKTYTSNCKQFLKFCRNLNGIDTQIEAKIIQTKIIQIIFNDLSFTKEQINIQQTNIQKIMEEVFFNLILFFSISLILIFYSSYKLSQYIQPAAQMIEIIQQQIRSQFDNTRYIKNTSQNFTYTIFQRTLRQFIQRHLSIRIRKISILNKYKFPSRDMQTKFDNFGLQYLEDDPNSIQYTDFKDEYNQADFQYFYYKFYISLVYQLDIIL
ncbi:hypothetical protein pb186bvf_015298 [Paramecium bursaria]